MSSNRVFFGKIGKNNQVERALPAEIGTSKPVRVPKNSNSAVRNIETTDEFHETVQTTYEWNHGRNPLSSIENNQNQGQSQPRSNYLPHRANRGVNDRSYKEKAEEMARQQLQDIWWLLYLEDIKLACIPAVHCGIQMEFYDRVKVQRGQTIKIKLKQKNPKRNDYMWPGVVKAIGEKEFVERCAEQMTQIIDSNKSYDVSQGPSLSESLLNSSAAKVPPFNTNIQERLELEFGNSNSKTKKNSLKVASKVDSSPLMSTAQNVANFKQKLPQIENIEEENFAQNENIEVENFAQNEIIEVENFAQNENMEINNFAQNNFAEHNYFARNIEQQENNEDIFNKDPDEEELCDTENIEPDIHPQNEMIIEQQENDQDIYGIDPDEEGLYATVDPNDVSYNPYFEMEELAVNSQKSTRRPVKRAESTPANKNKSKQAKGTSQLDPRDEFLVKAGQDFKHAAELLMDASSNQVNSMKSLEAAIEKLANRNYHEIQSSTDAVKQLVSLKFLRTALFTRR